MKIRLMLILLSLNVFFCSYYIPYKFKKILIEESNNSYLMFSYKNPIEKKHFSLCSQACFEVRRFLSIVCL